MVAALVVTSQADAQYYQKQISLSTSASSITADGEATIDLVAIVTMNGQPVQSYLVVFDADYGWPWPYLAYTDQNGIATTPYHTIFDGSRTVYAIDSADSENYDTETVTANAPIDDASTLAVSVSPAPTSTSTVTTVTYTWNAKRKGKNFPPYKPYRITITYRKPDNTTVDAVVSHRDERDGEIAYTTTWPAQGEWTVTAKLEAADRKKSNGIDYRLLATSQPVTFTVP